MGYWGTRPQEELPYLADPVHPTYTTSKDKKKGHRYLSQRGRLATISKALTLSKDSSDYLISQRQSPFSPLSC